MKKKDKEYGMRYGVMHHVKAVKNGALYKNISEEDG